MLEPPMRPLVTLALSALLTALAAAEPVLPEVPDPFGLGRRLALIDLLQSAYGVQIEPGTDEVTLEDLYRQALREAGTPATPPVATTTPAVDDGVVDRTIDCPGLGWSLTIADLGWGPIMARRGRSRVEGEAVSRDGLQLWIRVGFAEAGCTHDHVRSIDWSQAYLFPAIDQTTVVIERDPRYVAVRYREMGIPQASYYFVFHGCWAIVHIKDPRPGADPAFAAFARHLAYRECATPALAIDSTAVGGRQVAWSTPPAGWLVAVRGAWHRGRSQIHFCTTGGSLNVTLTTDDFDPRPVTDAELQAVVAASIRPYLAASVEGEPRLVALVGAGGSGYAATATNAALVGAPPEHGRNQLVTRGVFRIGPVDAVFTLSCEGAGGAVAAEGLDIVRSFVSGIPKPP
jgi:hypothetical protein